MTSFSLTLLKLNWEGSNGWTRACVSAGGRRWLNLLGLFCKHTNRDIDCSYGYTAPPTRTTMPYWPGILLETTSLRSYLNTPSLIACSHLPSRRRSNCEAETALHVCSTWSTEQGCTHTRGLTSHFRGVGVAPAFPVSSAARDHVLLAKLKHGPTVPLFFLAHALPHACSMQQLCIN